MTENIESNEQIGSEAAPFALLVEWTVGATEQEIEAAHEHVKAIMKDMATQKAEDMPAAIQRITIKRI